MRRIVRSQTMFVVALCVCIGLIPIGLWLFSQLLSAAVAAGPPEARSEIEVEQPDKRYDELVRRNPGLAESAGAKADQEKRLAAAETIDEILNISTSQGQKQLAEALGNKTGGNPIGLEFLGWASANPKDRTAISSLKLIISFHDFEKRTADLDESEHGHGHTADCACRLLTSADDVICHYDCWARSLECASKLPNNAEYEARVDSAIANLTSTSTRVSPATNRAIDEVASLLPCKTEVRKHPSSKRSSAPSQP